MSDNTAERPSAARTPKPAGKFAAPAKITAVKLLGLGRVHRHGRLRDDDLIKVDRLSVHDLVSKGLPNSSLISILRASSLSQSQISGAIRVGVRTVQRLAKKTTKTTLSAEASSGLWQFAEIYARAIDVLGSRELADRWLQAPAVALNGRAPLELLSTVQGAELVTDTLERLDHGVYI